MRVSIPEKAEKEVLRAWAFIFLNNHVIEKCKILFIISLIFVKYI